MFNRRNLLLLILLVTMFVCLVLTFLVYRNTPKIAFVRSAVIIENYLGMKEAKAAYDQKAKEWNKNIDTLQARYIQSDNFLKNNRNRLNRSEITRLEKELSKRGNDYKRYTDEIEKISKEENEKLTQGAFNQINSFIEKYSKENNIDIVIGVTLSGNVLYGADKMDITDKILEGLNKSCR